MKYKKQLVFLNQARANHLGAQFALNDTLNIKGSLIMYDTEESSLFEKDLEIAHQETLREYIGAVQVYYETYLNMMRNVGHNILLSDNNTL